MDFYAEPAFFVLLVPLLAVAVALGLAGRSPQRFGCVASVLMCVLLFFRSPASGLLFCGFVAMSAALYVWVRTAFAKDPDSEKAPFAYWASLALTLAPLVVYKVGVLVKPDFLGFVGISYITFKALQVLIEVKDGLIKDMSVAEYIGFLAFFPTITSGPIMRSRPFVDDLRAKLARDDYLLRLYQGLGWFVVGACYKFVASAVAQWALWFVPSITTGAVAWLARTFFFGLDLFFDFAGYSDMAAGVGLILGFDVPRNFRAPFLATDILEFWDRWHITLSTWLRDFVFMRFSRFALSRKLFGDRVRVACMGFLLNMGLMGLWHGITVPYIAYGLYHGVLLALFHLYQKKSKFYKANRRKRWYKIVSWACTMVFVFFGFALFAGYVL